jgi:hypothetical protein
MKLTNINEILEISKTLRNEYHTKRIEETIQQYREVEKYFPCYLVADIETNENYNYLESIEIFLKHETIKIQIRFDDYRKKWYIFAHFSNMYPNLSHDFKTWEQRKHPEPQNIGVLTTKKIENWVKYYENLDAIFSAKNNDNKNTIQEFRNKLAGLPVKWSKDNASGYIDNNGLTYYFNICETGHITERIEIKDRSNLETFLKLSK